MYPSTRLFAALLKTWCGGTSACLVTSGACKIRALQSHICAYAIGFDQNSIANTFRPFKSSMNLIMKNCFTCLGGVLGAAPASASVTVISRSLVNTLVSLPQASLSSTSGQHGVVLRPAPSRRDGQLSGTPSPSGPFGNFKQRGGTRVSDGDGLQQSPQGDDYPQIQIFGQTSDDEYALGQTSDDDEDQVLGQIVEDQDQVPGQNSDVDDYEFGNISDDDDQILGQTNDDEY
ncbi:MAG: hypothetical protein EZS28_011587 [Streblomastix strix]|uniref:Uncharacterized protein n=1 Tax=Streblomastix strix TaxID=222440 RepID=A0A5J4WD21_9EUKA|nr:MAG: hypothetical protein EZS28_011587 [Streblomastix strix]